MKLLVIGLDGVDTALVDKFDMPYLKSFLSDSSRSSVVMHEDLWSRGWSKILSGLPSETTGAFYEKPKLNGTTEFTQGFGTLDYDSGKQSPLWQVFASRGLRAGWYCVPTTLPAPKIDGFVFAGAGGGYSPSGRVPEIACHPESIRKDIVSDQVIWENRFCTSGIESADLYIQRCIDAIWRRAKSFVSLSLAGNALDFSFFVQKESVLLTNIFQYNINNRKFLNSTKDRRIWELLCSFYCSLDDTIEYVIDRLAPSNVGFLSDHGAAPYKRSVNFNAVLNDCDMLALSVEASSKLKRHSSELTEKIKRVASRIYLKSFQGTYPAYFPKAEQIDYKKSRAFAHFYVPGIYINDSRFHGPVKGEAEAQKLTTTLVDMLNSNDEAKQAGFVARPYRSEFSEYRNSAILPDIWVDIPVEYFPEQRGNFIQHNPYYKNWSDIRYLDRDIGSGKKHPNALFNFDSRFISDEICAQNSDLTAAYPTILNHFS